MHVLVSSLTVSAMARRPYDKAVLEELGRLVVMRRTDLGMGSQDEFAKRSQLTVDRVGALERGDNWLIARTRHWAEEALRWKPGAIFRITERLAAGEDPRLDEEEASRPSIYPSRNRAARIRALEEERARIDAELEQLRD